MNLPEIEQEALALGEQERAALVVRLISTLPASIAEVSDDEAIQRDEELENGTVKPLTQDEFVRRAEKARRG